MLLRPAVPVVLPAVMTDLDVIPRYAPRDRVALTDEAQLSFHTPATPTTITFDPPPRLGWLAATPDAKLRERNHGHPEPVDQCRAICHRFAARRKSDVESARLTPTIAASPTAIVTRFTSAATWRETCSRRRLTLFSRVLGGGAQRDSVPQRREPAPEGGRTQAAERLQPPRDRDRPFPLLGLRRRDPARRRHGHAGAGQVAGERFHRPRSRSVDLLRTVRRPARRRSARGNPLGRSGEERHRGPAHQRLVRGGAAGRRPDDGADRRRDERRVAQLLVASAARRAGGRAAFVHHPGRAAARPVPR